MVQPSLCSLWSRLQFHRTAPNHISLHQGPCYAQWPCCTLCSNTGKKGFALKSITQRSMTASAWRWMCVSVCVRYMCLCEVIRLSEIRLKPRTLFSWPGWRVSGDEWGGRWSWSVCAGKNRKEGIEGGKERKSLNSFILSPPHASPPPLCDSPSPFCLIVRVLGPSLTFNKSL